jgi:hypothetical protein
MRGGRCPAPSPPSPPPAPAAGPRRRPGPLGGDRVPALAASSWADETRKMSGSLVVGRAHVSGGLASSGTASPSQARFWSVRYSMAKAGGSSRPDTGRSRDWPAPQVRTTRRTGGLRRAPAACGDVRVGPEDDDFRPRSARAGGPGTVSQLEFGDPVPEEPPMRSARSNTVTAGNRRVQVFSLAATG